MEKQVIIQGVKYSMKKTGYGQYTVTKELSKNPISVHSTDSQTFDWMDDISNCEKNRQAKKSLTRMFKD